jgi:hypothetical protein
MKANWTVNPKFVVEPCDVYLPASAAPAARRRRNNHDDPFGTTITVIERKKTNMVKK